MGMVFEMFESTILIFICTATSLIMLSLNEICDFKSHQSLGEKCNRESHENNNERLVPYKLPFHFPDVD